MQFQVSCFFKESYVVIGVFLKTVSLLLFQRREVKFESAWEIFVLTLDSV